MPICDSSLPPDEVRYDVLHFQDSIGWRRDKTCTSFEDAVSRGKVLTSVFGRQVAIAETKVTYHSCQEVVL